MAPFATSASSGTSGKQSLSTSIGLLCSYFCGTWKQRRRAAALVQRSRKLVEKLAQADGKLTKDDDFVPFEHLRAAEQHLAAVEQWLACPSWRQSRQDVQQSDQIERLARNLGFIGEEQHEDDAAGFWQFFPPVAGETFVTVVACSVKSRTFRHPGKLYISSKRLCFYSCVVGVESSLAVPWEEVASIRLSTDQHVNTYPVQLRVKSDIAFDGQNVSKLSLCIFDLMGLKTLTKSTIHFLGTDLFGTYQDSATELQIMAHRSTSTISLASPSHQRARAQTRYAGDLLRQSEMWELERRGNIFQQDWRVPFLPHDGAAKMKWCAFEDKYIRHPFLSEQVDPAKVSASEIPPVEKVDFLGQVRKCTWSTAPTEGETDELGWQYAADFLLTNEFWQPYCSTFSLVRRRCWKPTFYNDVEEVVRRKPSSFVKQKGLSVGNIFEADVGEIPLEKLGEALIADDWKSEGGLMARYFKATGTQDLDIGEWADGGASIAAVEGKVRSIEMRVPVPPAPMCPKQTRVTSTWHVAVFEHQVLLECVAMSLDVPCGTCFNTVSCDTFTVEKGRMKMVRTCGIEWIQSSWTKSLVESNAPPQLAKVAQTLAGVVQNWGHDAAAVGYTI